MYSIRLSEKMAVLFVITELKRITVVLRDCIMNYRKRIFAEIVIISITKSNIFTFCLLCSKYASLKAPAIRFGKNADSPVRVGILHADPRRIVCRAIIHEEEFKVPEVLPQNRFNAFSQAILRIVDWHDNRKPRVFRILLHAQLIVKLLIHRCFSIPSLSGFSCMGLAIHIISQKYLYSFICAITPSQHVCCFMLGSNKTGTISGTYTMARRCGSGSAP